MATTKDLGPRGAESNELAELLACEFELAELLARTQEQGRHLVEEARAETGRAEVDMEASLEAESDRERARIREETQTSVREIWARARRRVAAFEGVPDERVERLAEAAFRRLIGAEDST